MKCGVSDPPAPSVGATAPFARMAGGADLARADGSLLSEREVRGCARSRQDSGTDGCAHAMHVRVLGCLRPAADSAACLGHLSAVSGVPQ